MFADTERLFLLLAFSFAVGAGLGALYDAFMLLLDLIFPEKKREKQAPRILSGSSRELDRLLFPIDKSITARVIVMFITDLLFCLVAALSVIILIFHLNYGEIRAFSLISAIIGFFLYRNTVGRPIRFITERVISMTFSVFKKLTVLLIIPILKPLADKVRKILNTSKRKKDLKRTLKVIAVMEQSERLRQEKRNL